MQKITTFPWLNDNAEGAANFTSRCLAIRTLTRSATNGDRGATAWVVPP
jgi:hypothetical protein